MKLNLIKINKAYNKRTIYKDFSIEFNSDKINCILGKSGGGKSTLLDIIAGVKSKDSGHIDGINRDDISYVFQEDRLVPWLTVKQNMELFMYNYYDHVEAQNVLNNYLDLLEIKHTIDKIPEKLSGGERQRVNILRALIKPSKVILMDEPFKSLDYKVKYLIIDKIKKIFLDEGRIIIFVTHDVDEAIYMDGKIFVLGGNPFSIKACFDTDLNMHKNDIISII